MIDKVTWPCHAKSLLHIDVLFLCVFPVRSRVLLSVVDDLDSEEFLDYSPPATNIFDAVDQLLPSAPTKHLTAAENETNKIVSMETVARENRKNESQLVASAAWNCFLGKFNQILITIMTEGYFTRVVGKKLVEEKYIYFVFYKEFVRLRESVIH